MKIAENTTITISIVVVLLGFVVSGTAFVSRMHVRSEQQEQEIARLHETILAESRLKWTRINDLETRLSRIEGKLTSIEKWCKEIVEDIRERRQRR